MNSRHGLQVTSSVPAAPYQKMPSWPIHQLVIFKRSLSGAAVECWLYLDIVAWLCTRRCPGLRWRCPGGLTVTLDRCGYGLEKIKVLVKDCCECQLHQWHWRDLVCWAEDIQGALQGTEMAVEDDMIAWMFGPATRQRDWWKCFQVLFFSYNQPPRYDKRANLSWGG